MHPFFLKPKKNEMATSVVSKQSIGAQQLNANIPRESTLIADIKTECCKLCNWERESFPGSQPVSLSRNNLAQIARSPYVVCEKSDGERHLMLIYKQAVYIIDRMFNIYRVGISFPDLDRTSLLDGELIIDSPPNGKQIIRYLVYDAIHVRGKSVAKESLLFRLNAAFTQLIKPRSVSTSDMFAVYVKDFYDVCDSAQIVFPLAQRLPHLCDGLIFTPVNDAYVPGTCSRLLKWKPAHMNTVDFVLDLVMGFEQGDVHAKLLPATGGVQKHTGLWLARSGPMWNWLVENRKEANNKIGECGWDPTAYTFIPSDKKEYTSRGVWAEEPGAWVLHRIRDDRTIPNDVSVVEKVKASIKDGISIEHLAATLNKVPRLKVTKSVSGRKRELDTSDNHKPQKEIRV